MEVLRGILLSRAYGNLLLLRSTGLRFENDWSYRKCRQLLAPDGEQGRRLDRPTEPSMERRPTRDVCGGCDIRAIRRGPHSLLGSRPFYGSIHVLLEVHLLDL
ncbi:hypothetical protein ScPMuIL_017226 [Solemya velum]